MLHDWDASLYNFQAILLNQLMEFWRGQEVNTNFSDGKLGYIQSPLSYVS